MAKRSKRKPAPPPSASPRDTPPSSAEVVMPGRWMVFLQAALIIGLGLWVYSPAFHGDWLWDDDWYITNQPLLRDGAGLWKFWFQPGSWVEYYPIEETFLWIEWHLWGDDTLGYHLVTIALHIANALLVWRLLGRFGLPKAWLGGLLFAIHPAAVDSVAWIVETKNTLSLLPLLLAMCAWIDYDRTRKPRDYGLALAFFLTAMLCKIEVAPFPVLILLYAWWKRRQIGWADLAGSAPFFAVSLVLGLTTIACSVWYDRNFGITPEALPDLGLFSRVALAGVSLALYFSHVIWPVHLFPIYTQWKVDPSSPIQYLPWAILGGALYGLWRQRESWGRHALLGLVFFLVFLAPFLGFNLASYMTFTWIMDHFLYIPLIGLIGLAVAALGSIEESLPATSRPVITGITTLLIALLAFEANGYAVAYSDEATLWGYTVERNPQSWMAQGDLGKALILLNQPQDAIAHLQQSQQALEDLRLRGFLDLRTERAQTHLNLGRALVLLNRVPEGIAEYDQALALEPSDPGTYNQKGVALLQAGRIPEALTQFDQALKLCPNYAIALDNKGSALAQSGRLPEAIDCFTAALKLTPDDVSTLDNLGSALIQSGRPADALAAFQHALQIDPTDPKALENQPRTQPASNEKP